MSSAPNIIPRESYAFMVWRKNKGRPPRFRHETREAAEAEATRLAATHPGATFVVLQELLRVQSNPEISTSRLEEPGGLMPPDPSGSEDMI